MTSRHAKCSLYEYVVEVAVAGYECLYFSLRADEEVE